MAIRACVVGFGIAGAATSLLLARTGRVSVKLLEAKHADVLHVPSVKRGGIRIQPCGLKVLQRLGMLEDVKQQGAIVDSMKRVGKDGKVVFDLNYRDFDPRVFALGVHRTTLQEQLSKHVLCNDQIELHCGIPVTDCRIAKTSSAYKLDPSGSYVKLEDGSLDGPFDLIVIADGRSSTIRRSLKSLGLWSYEHWYGSVFASAVLKDQNGFLKSKGNVVYQRVLGTDVATFVPIGQGSIGVILNGTAVNTDLGAWKGKVGHLEPEAFKLLDQIESSNELNVMNLSTTVMPKFYFGDSLVVVGEAAHTTPDLDQGVTSDLVDAFVLSKALEGSEFNVSKALRVYNSMRKWPTRSELLNSFLLQQNVPSTLVNGLCRIPPLKKQMLITMVGVQKGLLPFYRIEEDNYVL